MKYLFLSLSSLDNAVRHGVITPEETHDALFCFAASRENTYELDSNTDHWLWEAENDPEVRRIVWRHENEPGNTYWHAMRCNYLLRMHGYRPIDIESHDFHVGMVNLFGLAERIREANPPTQWADPLIVITMSESFPDHIRARYNRA